MDNKLITVTSPLLPDLTEFNELLKDIWNRKWITNNGHYHKELEKELAAYLKVPYREPFHQWYLAFADCASSLAHHRRSNHHSLQLCGNHPQYLVERMQARICGYRPGNR